MRCHGVLFNPLSDRTCQDFDTLVFWSSLPWGEVCRFQGRKCYLQRMVSSWTCGWNNLGRRTISEFHDIPKRMAVKSSTFQKKTPQNSKCISLESILWVAFWDILSYTQKLRSPGAFVFWFWNGKLCDSGKPQQKSNIGFEQENTNSWLFSSSLSSFKVRQKHP